ncbi:PAS domain S-box protein [Enterovibrio coralii]|uniref:Sensor protein FixL n=1 Tax=Enterovibrio coralii TaxID=294935 RepID=A0A135IBE8_9GAMM|nr:PAS domain S-box protein [Enterovibrio coralii]KXF82791.1 hybrid sensor histidine kinase/response regulator [Enterovibrio coralii]
MSVIESLSLFILPPLNDQPVLTGMYEPWFLLLAVIATFTLVSLSFIHRPLKEGRKGVWKNTPIPVNALTLTSGLILLPVANVLANSAFREVGFSPTVLLLAVVPGAIAVLFALKLVTASTNSPVKIAASAFIVTITLSLQTLLTYACVNGVAVSQFDFSSAVLMTVGAGFLVMLGLWIRFSPKTEGRWDLNVSRSLTAGAVLTIAILIVALLSRGTLVLSVQPARVDGMPLLGRDMLIILAFSFLLAGIASPLVTAYYRTRVREHDLLKKGKELEGVMQTITDAVIAIDQNGTITFFNQSAERIFGWYASEVVGNNVRVLVTDEHQHRHDSYIHNYIEKRDSSVVGSVREVTAKRKDGSLLPVRLAIGHQALPGKHEFVAVISDISEQRHLAWALRENAKQYRSLIANLPCMAFREMTGAARHMVYISDAAKSITGYSASVLTGENGVSHFVDRIRPSDANNYRRARELASRRNGKYDCEYRFTTRDEQEKCFWEIGHSYRAEDGSTWIDGVIIDITEKREAEEEFEEKMRLAEKASQSKASFLANMSYEFRSPMNSILGLTNVLIDAEKNPSHRHHLEVIKESGESLMKLINDILDTSKLESQSLPLDMAEFSLAQLCRQIEFIARETVRARELHVTLHYSESLGDLYVGDARRVKQLLQNMMRSALTKTEEGHVALHVLPVNDMIRFTVATYPSCSQKRAQNEVDNTGQTLSATLITQLVELMRGNLWFDGETANNSLVYADLPLIQSQGVSASANEQIHHYALPPIEVLVIDDVQRNQQELRDISLRQGVKVLTFTDMVSAEDVIKTQPVDVVMLDAYLNEEFPDPKTLKQWAKQWAKEPPKVIALTLTVDPTPESEWLELGFDGVITKPFESAQVFEALKHCMGVHEETSNVMPIKAVKNDDELLLFDDNVAYRRWPTSEILLSVVRNFFVNYKKLPSATLRQLAESPDGAIEYLGKAGESAHYLGFAKLESDIYRIKQSLKNGDRLSAENRLKELGSTLTATIDQALAYLGVRIDELENDDKSVAMNAEQFARSAEVFASKLSEGQLDEQMYKSLIPLMTGLIAPAVLAQFVEAIENFELDEAYQLFLAAVEQFPSSENTGVTGYGV